ncbi:lipoyl(octanoyl) transferase [Geosmithia morbida]|uniref:Lipoyl(Octanoyl) transferase n=1 Tax=Geosmithia morbida TaxID=1094350 RepID=A0A9P4YWQ0_9HYPO|nr:lipoyl(octanoyl) transferase [Geosmithia morbida]KAF4124493.1 lipoyl(octanoyl) transferase [Geosmithia morbida]
MLVRIRTAPRLLHAPRPSTTTGWLSSAAAAAAPATPADTATSHDGILRHHHLHPGRLTSYDEAESLQESIRSDLLAWKGQKSARGRRGGDDHEPPPRPHLISFEAAPTFTLGRRQQNPPPEQMARLRRELRIADDGGRNDGGRPTSLTPAVRKTSRGGLTTYHGPGQMVLWPVLDMRSPLYPGYGVESYASHLESATQRLLADLFGIRTYISRDDPGVWVATPPGEPERKIAALGVHHRRHVTALGIAVNISIPVEGPEESNPWARFVPCGLDGKLVTSVANELGDPVPEATPGRYDVAALSRTWAEMFAEGLTDPRRRVFAGSRMG